ncbi:hypothetical protein [Jannaschia sp. LMIT008]|uniref:hypothetical protein n=1 Tax=Jannaschia maritima TaxID=3032585 RepID=UPI002810CC29|nr:hypothetical protein [Jannaschia sp. LMIT008]
MGAIAIPIGKLIVDGIIAGAVIIGGIILLSKVAELIGDYIARELSEVIERARECRNCDCGECVPPKGTVRYRVDWVPPSRPHWPCEGSHVHFEVRIQNPTTCACFWNKDRRKVLCLPDDVGPGDFDPSDLGPNVIPGAGT